MIILGSVFIVCCALFGSWDGSSFADKLIKAWKEKRLAELEVKRLEAEHALRCPRLGDIPRKAKSE